MHSRLLARLNVTTPQVRAFRDDVLAHIGTSGKLIDVRSPEEYSGERLHMPDYPNEGALRGGHVPGAANVPWASAANEDGTFKDASLRYETSTKATLACRPTTMSSCTAASASVRATRGSCLTNLLGYGDVKNYDGSWTEWGNSVGVPIEK